MKQIDAFVDSVYANARGNRKEIQELKAEMKNHLLEAIHELKAEGKSEQEAIEIAIERFGGEKAMRSIFGLRYPLKKVTYVLGVLAIFVNLWIGFDVLRGALEPLQVDVLFRISFIMFIPILFTILGLSYKKLFCMYIASFFSILLGLYLLAGEGLVQLYGGLQLLYLISTILMKIDILKAKKVLKEI